MIDGGGGHAYFGYKIVADIRMRVTTTRPTSASPAPTGGRSDPRQPDRDEDGQRARLHLLLRQRPAAAGRPAGTDDGAYWVENDLLETLTAGPDDRHGRVDGQVPVARSTNLRAMSEREPIGVVGVGWVGLVTAACFAELGKRGRRPRHPDAEKIEALRRGEAPFHEPGIDELLERNRERLTSPRTWPRCWSGPQPALLLRGHAADLLRRRRPLAGARRGRAACRRRWPHARHEEHGAGGHRRLDPPRRPGAVLRLLSRVPEGGHGRLRTSCTPTAS